MTNTENIVKIDIKGFYDLCNRLQELETENKQLKADAKIIGDELTYFKELCVELEDQINDLQRENDRVESKVDYLTSAKAGRDFAKSLLGGA